MLLHIEKYGDIDKEHSKEQLVNTDPGPGIYFQNNTTLLDTSISCFLTMLTIQLFSSTLHHLWQNFSLTQTESNSLKVTFNVAQIFF